MDNGLTNSDGVQTDAQLLKRVSGGDGSAFATLMQRHNQRLYRVARTIIQEEAEAEDIVQTVYLSAFTHSAQFSGRAQVSTWLTRIAINESLARRKSQKRQNLLSRLAGGVGWKFGGFQPDTPGEQVAGKQLAAELEAAIDSLPDPCRLAFVMLQVEGLKISEVASILSLSEAHVRTMRHRARASLRQQLQARFEGAGANSAFSFAGERCARIVATVLRGLQLTPDTVESEIVR